MEKKICEVCGKIINSRWDVRFDGDIIHCKECYRAEEPKKVILATKIHLPDVITYFGWVVFVLLSILAIVIYSQTSSFRLAFPWVIAAVFELLLLLAIARVLILLEVIAINTKR
jgi:hypothetical protein